MSIELRNEYLDRTRTMIKLALGELRATDEPWSSDTFGVIYDPRYENALHRIIRWQGSSIQLPSNVQETNWDHSIAMRDIFLEEITAICPEVNKRTMEAMIMLHDAREIYAGDLWFGNQDPILRQGKKMKEERAGYILTRNLQDPARSEIRSLFDRYTNRDPTDKEAAMTKWLDEVQANRFALTHNLYETIASPEEKFNHITDAISEFLLRKSSVVNSLDSSEARIEISLFVEKELNRFIVAGYEEEVKVAFERLSISMSSLTMEPVNILQSN